MTALLRALLLTAGALAIWTAIDPAPRIDGRGVVALTLAAWALTVWLIASRPYTPKDTP